MARYDKFEEAVLRSVAAKAQETDPQPGVRPVETRLRLRVTAEQGGKEVPGEQTEGFSFVEAFVHQMENCLNLMWQKEQAYRGAWREQGYMGQTARLLSKASRLKNMLWTSHPFEMGEEVTQDTVEDMVNLGIFWLLNKGQRNPWGREHRG